MALEENGTFTDQGYVRDTGDSFHEYYDGERGSIPDEYRVMTFQDDLPEEEKSEWAMDVAFDMDEFFRQNDPQYAAEHPEAHAAKEELYENLMAGRISTLTKSWRRWGKRRRTIFLRRLKNSRMLRAMRNFWTLTRRDQGSVGESGQVPY